MVKIGKLPKVEGFEYFSQFAITGKDTLSTFTDKKSAIRVFNKAKERRKRYTRKKMTYRFYKARKYEHIIYYVEK